MNEHSSTNQLTINQLQTGKVNHHVRGREFCSISVFPVHLVRSVLRPTHIQRGPWEWFRPSIHSAIHPSILCDHWYHRFCWSFDSVFHFPFTFHQSLFVWVESCHSCHP